MPDRYEPVGYRYRYDDREWWSFAPLEDAKSMQAMSEKGWQVEKVYRRTEQEVEGG